MVKLDDIKKLPPQERVEQLKKLREKQQEDQKKAEKLLKESETEVEEEVRKTIDESFEHLEQAVAPIIPDEDLEGTIANEPVPEIPDDHPSYAEQQMQTEHYKPATQYDPSLLEDASPGQQYDPSTEYSSSVVESIKTETDKITKKYDNTDP